MSDPIGPFVSCAICAGHEHISAKAASELIKAIDNHLGDVLNHNMPVSVATELGNILNAIWNTLERENKKPEPIDPLLA